MTFSIASVGWILTLIAGLGLAASTWRRTSSASLRAALAVLAALGLSLAVSDALLPAAFILVDLLLIVITWKLAKSPRVKSPLGLAWIAVIVALLAIAKLPPLASQIGVAAWIGISYLSFRLIHITLEARRDRLGAETLPDAVVYVLHPTTLIAGPIDRIQRNAAEQHGTGKDTPPPAVMVNEGIWRLLIGLFKKAALANLLYAFISAHDMTVNASLPTGIAWLWLLAYTLYLYIDFSAYSDMAVGVAKLMGIRLPENFASPYIQPTIAKFWQAWHITLSNWLRDYIFFPMSRNLLKKYGQPRQTLILFASHMTTMVACGLWHGIGTGFLMWGVWHGLGLFAYSQMPTLRRRFNLPLTPAPISTAFTFLFVMFGWVFFATDLSTALRIFARLFGVS
jgi:alginate O-acetyltransferase complex protein AlgI